MKKKKKYNSTFKQQKAIEFQNTIDMYSDFINIPQLSNDTIDYEYVNNTLGFDIIKSTNYNIINNELTLLNDKIIPRYESNLNDSLNKTYKIKIYPTPIQKTILINWMDSYIIMYNKVLEKIKKTRIEQTKKLNKVLKYNELVIDLNITKLKKEFAVFKDNLSLKTSINKHILDYAINDAVSKFKSVVSNLNNNHIKNARLRYLKKSINNKILKIEKQICSDNGFCTSVLGKQLYSNPVINYKKFITKVAILKYDYKKDNFIMYIKKQIAINKNNDNDKQKIISLDPGLRTFLTGVTNNHIIEIAPNLKNKFIKYYDKIDGIKSNLNVNHKRKHLDKYDKYIENYINDVHWQTVNLLTSNYNHIFLGNFSTKNMVESNKTSKLNKRIANTLKLYQFREKLKYKCLINNCKLKIINEYNTSKCCSNCGNIKADLGDNKIYKCKKCNHLYDRDVNAAKNILLKGLSIKPITIKKSKKK